LALNFINVSVHPVLMEILLPNFVFRISEIKNPQLNGNILSSEGDEFSLIILNGPGSIVRSEEFTYDKSKIDALENSIDNFNKNLMERVKSKKYQNIEVSSVGKLYHLSKYANGDLSLGLIDLYLQTSLIIFSKQTLKESLILMFPLVYELGAHKPKIHFRILDQSHVKMIESIQIPTKHHLLYGSFKIVAKNET